MQQRKVLTPAVQERIAKMKDKSPLEVSRILNIRKGTIREFMIQMGYHQVKEYQVVRRRKDGVKVKDGFFNEHERENWLI